MMTVEKRPFNSESIRSEFSLTGNAAGAITSRTTMVDELVAHAYRAWLSAAYPEGMTVLAVGGYGRRELYPYSDIDLLLLVSKPVQGDEKREALSAFLRTLWDSGLRLSQSVHTISECCQLEQANIELSISLLDQRFLVGDHRLYEELAERLPKFLRSHRQQLTRHLCQLAATRHAKYHSTIYHLEPNIKETPGGMRDLHLVHWLARLRGTDDETLGELEVAREFLSNLRCKLHYKAGRDNNLLTFDLQEELAEDPAEWMREYYRHARDIHRTALRHMEQSESQSESGLTRSFREWRSRLSNADFTVSRERVFFRSPQQLAHDPALVFRLIEFVGRHGIRLSLEAERRIRDHRLYFEEYFASHQTLWPILKTILSQPHTSLAIRTMYETGLLLSIFPDWEQIECLVVRDFYHRYTVDEHTLVTLEYLEELRATENPPRRRFAELLAETENLPLLYVALLFHDTGKSSGLEGHAAGSARLAERLLERIGVPDSERRIVVFLIEHHLDLSAVMNARDLSDPATAGFLAARVETIENLKQLTLLTYSDISAVNPDAMTPWRLEQLWRTYVVTYRELTRELVTERIRSERLDEKGDFLEGFPTRYLRTHTEEQIREHLELGRKSRESGVAIDLQRENGTYVITVVTDDRPFLFASLAGALSSFGLNILKAEAFSNNQGTALDTFTFADPLRTLELNPMETDRLKLIIQRAALGKEDVRKLLKGRSRPAQPSRAHQPSATVAFDMDASNEATLVEIVTEDRPGLLYDFASTFSAAGCSIEVVLIDTEARKALDVFYVTKEGKKLDPGVQTDLKNQLLAVCNG
jgi:[protein-PII] uridylyltransferase